MNHSRPTPLTRRELHGSSRRLQPTPKVASDSLARVLGITILGVFLPGLNFLLAGKKKTGIFLLTLFLLALTAVSSVVLLFEREEVLNAGLSIFSDSTGSLAALAVLGAISLGSFLNVFCGYRAARSGEMSLPKKTIVFILAVMLALIAAAPAAYAVYYTHLLRNTLTEVFVEDTPDSQSSSPDPSTKPTSEPVLPWDGKDRINVLLLGSDAGPNRTGTRPDTIMVASIEVDSGQTSLFTLPRNLQYAPFEQGTPGSEQFPQGFTAEDRLLNSIWLWGETNAHLFPGVDEPGLQATQDAVAGVLGLSIDYHASVDMEGFSKGVDALGGVRVNVPRDLPIGKTGEYTDRYVKAGQDRLLNGYEALWYVRSRADSSDYDRMLRSRCMVSSLTEAVNPTTLAVKFPEITQILRDHVDTNIPQDELIKWAELTTKINSSKIKSLPFTDDVIRPYNPDYEQIRSQVQELLRAVPNPTTAPTSPAQPSGESQDEVETAENEGVKTVSTAC